MATSAFVITAPLARVPIGAVTIDGQAYPVPMDQEWLRYLTVQLPTAIGAGGSGTGGGVTSIAVVAPLTSTGGTTPTLGIGGLTGFGTPGQAPVVNLTSDGLLWATPAGGGGTYPKGAFWDNFGARLSLTVMPDFTALPCQATGVIKQVEIVTKGGAGSVQFDIWKVPFASYPPLVANTICGANYPTITAGTTMIDTTLTSWTTAVTKGDVLLFHPRSISTFTAVQIGVEIG